MKTLVFSIVLFSISLLTLSVNAQDGRKHPLLVLNTNDISQMRLASTELPYFKAAYTEVRSFVETVMSEAIDVPVPKDAGGGYTHEQHKKNYKAIRDAGMLYQITQDKKYLDYVKRLLMAYAELYPTLSEHPKKKEQAPGRLFWQSLNESVWLVNSIQGYDAVYEALTIKEREKIEMGVLRPMANFLSEESPFTFNKIHNHGTWAVAAVGMTGYVIGDKSLVEKALLGLDKSGNAGFIKQLDKLFSPDGYYTEGPYYQRYALMPFVLFAKAIDYNEPERKIFQYRDGILLKAIYTTIQLSYAGLFFPINDALKDKGLKTRELVLGVAVAYGLTKDPALLSIAKSQQTINFSGDGVLVAKGLNDGKDIDFPFLSMQLSDGSDGDEGALSIFRTGKEAGHMAVVMKNTSQGMGHGHFDKLSWLFYNNGKEIITDYGAARFLNVETKYGGHYLPENKTWAKQTIAHNTLVVDEQSHFNGKLSKASQHHPQSLFFAVDESIQISAAKAKGTYPGVDLIRTMALIKIKGNSDPILLDVFNVSSKAEHQYDLPLHYRGHIVNTNFSTAAATTELKAFGDKNGYQHLWVKAKATPKVDLPQVTWLQDDRFYTYTMLANKNSSTYFLELGANDPNFNLRRENVIVKRVKDKSNFSFISLLETHGEYNPTLEYTKNAISQIEHLQYFNNNDSEYIQITTKKGQVLGLGLSYNGNQKSKHSIQVEGKRRVWRGSYHLFED